MAILCIGIMVSAVGKQNVERYFGILSLIAGKDCLGLENHALVATSMTCIGSMVSVLGPRCLPMVPQILERILDILETPEIDLIVAECGLDTLATFFEVLPLFITFFIPRIVKLVTRSMPEALGSHRDELCALIGTNTQHSALSSHISRFVADINQSDELFIAPLLLIIKSLMKATAPQELMDSRNSYHNIFTALLPIQPEATILVIQEYIVNINETAFKPFFAGLVKWGRDNPVLLQIADMLLDTLKSLFIHHTTLIMDILLEDVNELKLSILTKVFAYDTVEYTSQDRFEKVSAVLLKCLNDGLPVEKALVALSTCRADLFKTIHKPILLSLRNDSDAVQICGIEIIKNLYEELPNMIQFFPEQVPFLAELLEDGSEQVQENTRELCDSIQSVLGEPIEQYFK